MKEETLPIISCPVCLQRMKGIPLSYRGRKGRCPSCRAFFIVDDPPRKVETAGQAFPYPGAQDPEATQLANTGSPVNDRKGPSQKQPSPRESLRPAPGSSIRQVLPIDGEATLLEPATPEAKPAAVSEIIQPAKKPQAPASTQEQLHKFMAICPDCAARINNIPARYQHKKVRCPRCQSFFVASTSQPIVAAKKPLLSSVVDPLATQLSPAPTHRDAPQQAAMEKATPPASGDSNNHASMSGCRIPCAPSGITPAKAVESTSLGFSPVVSGGRLEVSPANEEVPTVWHPGQLIMNTYAVQQILGQGAFGTVYKVHHLGWEVELAVKTPNPEALDAHGAAIFTSEAETWSSLGLHPHIVSCYYVRNLGAIPRVFAEFVDGGSLQQWIERQQVVSLEKKLDIAIQFAWGLAYAHSRQLVHKDIKPANVMLTSDGRVKITDFGLTAAKNSSHQKRVVGQGGERTILVDGLGCTPAYAAPEQLAGQPVSRAADAWSYAVSLLAMFTGGARWLVGAAAPAVLDDLIATSTGKGQQVMPASLAALLQECFVVEPEQRLRDMNKIAEKLITIYGEELSQVYPRTPPRQDQASSADSLVNQAMSRLDLGDKDKALELLKKALLLQPLHPEATYNLGLLRWRAGEIHDNEVLAGMEEVFRSRGDNWTTSLLISQLHLERGDIASAYDILRQADQAQPEIAHAIESLPDDKQYQPFEIEFQFPFNPMKNLPLNCILNKERLILCSAGDHRLTEINLRADGVDMRPFEQPEVFIGEKVFACCPERNLIAAASADGMVVLFDAGSRQPLRTLQTTHNTDGKKSGTNALRFCKKGTLLLGILDGVVHAWDLEAGAVRTMAAGESVLFSRIACDLDGQMILLDRSGIDGPIDRLHLDAWLLDTFLLPKRGRIFLAPLAVSSDGERAYTLANFSEDLSRKNVLVAWDVATEKYRDLCQAGLEFCHGLAIPPGGNLLLASGQAPGAQGFFHIKIFDAVTGRSRYSTSVPGDATSTATATRDDGSGIILTAVVKRGFGRLFYRRQLLASPRPAPFAICRIRSSEVLEEERKRFVAAITSARKALDGSNYGLSLDQLRQARHEPSFSRDARAANLGRLLCRRLAKGPLCDIWQEQSFSDSYLITPGVRQGGASGLLIRANGQFFVAYSVDFDSGEIHPDQAFDATAIRGGLSFLTCDRGGLLCKNSPDETVVLDVHNGREICRIATGREVGSLLASNEDGSLLVTGNGAVWCGGSGRLVRAAPGSRRMQTACFTKDGAAVYLHNREDGLLRYDIASGGLQRYPLPEWEESVSLCLQPADAVVILGIRRKEPVLALLDSAGNLQREAVLPWPLVRREMDHGESHLSMDLALDGNLLVICGQQGKVLLWDVQRWMLLTTLHLAIAVKSVRFLGSPSRLLICGQHLLDKAGSYLGLVYHLDWELHQPTEEDLKQATPLLQGFLARHQVSRHVLPLGEESSPETILASLQRQALPAYGPVDLARLRVEIAASGFGDWPMLTIASKLRLLQPAVAPCPLNNLLQKAAAGITDRSLLCGESLVTAGDMIELYQRFGISSGETVLAAMVNTPSASSSAWLVVTDGKLIVARDKQRQPLCFRNPVRAGLFVNDTSTVSLTVDQEVVADNIPGDRLLTLRLLIDLIGEVGAMLYGVQTDDRGASAELCPPVAPRLVAKPDHHPWGASTSNPLIPPPFLPDVTVNQAVGLLEAGKLAEGGQLLDNVLRLQPHHPEATFNLGLLRWRRGEISDEECIAWLREVVSSHQSNPLAPLLLGLAHMERGDYAAGTTALQASLALAPDLVQAEEALAICRRYLPDSNVRPQPLWRMPTGPGSPGDCLVASNGERLLLPFRDKPVADILDTSTGLRVLRIEATSGKRIVAATLSPDGSLGLIATDNLTIECWEVASGTCLQVFTASRLPGAPLYAGINSVQIHHDNITALACGAGVALQEWDLASSTLLRTYDSTTPWTQSVFSQDGELLVAIDEKSRLGIWEHGSGNLLHLIETEEKLLCLTCTREKVVGATIGGSLMLFDAGTGERVGKFRSKRNWSKSLVCSDDGRLLAAVGASGQDPITLWDIGSGRCLRTFTSTDPQVLANGAVTNCCFTSGEEIRLSVFFAKYDAISRADWSYAATPAHYMPCTAAAITESSDIAARFCEHLDLAHNDLADKDYAKAVENLNVARKLPGLYREPQVVCLHGTLARHLPRLSLTGGWQTKAIDTGVGQIIKALTILPEKTSFLSYSTITGHSSEKAFQLWDVNSGGCLREFGASMLPPLAKIKLAAGGRKILTAFDDQRTPVSIWDIGQGRVVSVLEQSELVTELQLSPCQYLAIGVVNIPPKGEYRIGVWDLGSGKLLHFLQAHDQAITALAISRDGCHLLSSDATQTILWKVATASPLEIFPMTWPGVQRTCFFPGGKSLLGLGRGSLYLYDLQDSNLTLRSQTHHPVGMGQEVEINSQRRYSLSCQSRDILLQDLHGTFSKRVFAGHQANVSALAISPDDRFFISGDVNGQIRHWTLDWELQARDPVDWDEAAEPYLRDFLALQQARLNYHATNIVAGADNSSSGNQEIHLSSWNEIDFTRLLQELEDVGLGWIRPEGIRNKLESLARIVD